MVWLAEEYQRRSSSEPSLTLEEFAVEYGVSADELRSHIPDLSREVDYSMTLWHGTTRSRAESILKQGFRVKKARNRRRIFFAGRSGMAQGIAERRARSEDDQPAVIMCCIDLSRYPDFERRGNSVYAFRHERIDCEVIRKVTGLQRQSHEKPEKYESKNIELADIESPSARKRKENIDVAVTFNSGHAGITYWINSYLKLNDQSKIGEDHKAVEKMKRWLDEQLDSGRFGEVPHDEMLAQLREYLPQYSQ